MRRLLPEAPLVLADLAFCFAAGTGGNTELDAEQRIQAARLAQCLTLHAMIVRRAILDGRKLSTAFVKRAELLATELGIPREDFDELRRIAGGIDTEKWFEEDADL